MLYKVLLCRLFRGWHHKQQQWLLSLDHPSRPSGYTTYLSQFIRLNPGSSDREILIIRNIVHLHMWNCIIGKQDQNEQSENIWGMNTIIFIFVSIFFYKICYTHEMSLFFQFISECTAMLYTTGNTHCVTRRGGFVSVYVWLSTKHIKSSKLRYIIAYKSELLNLHYLLIEGSNLHIVYVCDIQLREESLSLRSIFD